MPIATGAIAATETTAARIILGFLHNLDRIDVMTGVSCAGCDGCGSSGGGTGFGMPGLGFKIASVEVTAILRMLPIAPIAP
ncbi:MAG: hypothetical protein F6J87_02050 [Spirulina sp. SIO3F2]|nr:hypothetical protein [Spirulina sp. SIO3F2]